MKDITTAALKATLASVAVFVTLTTPLVVRLYLAKEARITELRISNIRLEEKLKSSQLQVDIAIVSHAECRTIINEITDNLEPRPIVFKEK